MKILVESATELIAARAGHVAAERQLVKSLDRLLQPHGVRRHSAALLLSRDVRLSPPNVVEQAANLLGVVKADIELVALTGQSYRDAHAALSALVKQTIVETHLSAVEAQKARATASKLLGKATDVAPDLWTTPASVGQVKRMEFSGFQERRVYHEKGLEARDAQSASSAMARWIADVAGNMRGSAFNAKSVAADRFGVTPRALTYDQRQALRAFRNGFEPVPPHQAHGEFLARDLRSQVRHSLARARGGDADIVEAVRRQLTSASVLDAQYEGAADAIGAAASQRLTAASDHHKNLLAAIRETASVDTPAVGELLPVEHGRALKEAQRAVAEVNHLDTAGLQLQLDRMKR